jgi:hypothetical protein
VRPKDVIWPIVGVASGIAALFAVQLGFGDWPHPVVAAGILLVALGAGLVAARFSRLGPFDGELGAPWFENDLRETLSWEFERAARYGRIVTVVILRQQPDAANWDAVVRAVDRVITCRNNWTIMILPETTREGAASMLRRLAEAGEVAHAAIMQLPIDIENRDRIPQAILAAMHAAPRPGSVVLVNAGAQEALSLAS